MIRAAIISLVFLGITLTLILMQPGSEHASATTQPETAPAVTRAQTEFESLGVLDEPLDVASQIASQTTVPEVQTSTSYTPQPAYTQAPVETAAALLTQPAVAPTYAQPETPLEALIVSALTQGQSEDYIDALVNDAASQGVVEVPQTLITEDGRVDTSSLLAVLSSSSRSPSALPGSAQSYVVQPGDSLASISYRFFGNTGKAVDIFMANRAVLQSPNHVEAGQSLVIPAL